MTYLNSFEVIHYRGIDALSLPRLSRANLVTGVNGIGKTALLDRLCKALRDSGDPVNLLSTLLQCCRATRWSSVE